MAVKPKRPAYARQSYVFDADSDLKEKQHEWAASGQTTLSGFSHLFDQDASGKIIKVFASSANWQFSPQPHSEDYGDVNALDQYAGVDLGDGSGSLEQIWGIAISLTETHLV